MSRRGNAPWCSAADSRKDARRARACVRLVYCCAGRQHPKKGRAERVGCAFANFGHDLDSSIRAGSHFRVLGDAAKGARLANQSAVRVPTLLSLSRFAPLRDLLLRAKHLFVAARVVWHGLKSSGGERDWL